MIRSSNLLRPALILFLVGALGALANGCKKGEEGAAPGGPSTAPGAASSPNGSPGTPATPGAPGAATGSGGLASLPAGEGAMDPAQIPSVAADVNGSLITHDELVRGAQTAQGKLARAGQKASLTPELYQEVLEDMIIDRLLQQDSKGAGYVATSAELDTRLAMFKSQLPSEEAYKQMLQANQVSEERFKESLAKGIAVERYVREKLMPATPVSPDEVKKYYEGNRPLFAVPEQAHVRHIQIRVDPNGTPEAKEAARKKAADLLKQVQGGADFAQLAAANSDDVNSKGRGGDLGWIPRGQTLPAFDKAVFALAKPGDLAPVVETPNGFHVIQLGARKQPSVMELDQVKDRIAQVLQQRKVLESLKERVKALTASGKVKVYLK